jgi:phospholipid transport system substrate-binding protein
LLALFALGLMLFSPAVHAADKVSVKDPAIVFVDSLADTFIHKIFVKDNKESERVNDFRTVFKKNCDIPFISKFVLGKAYKTASADERKSFQDTFTENVVLTWAGRFKEYAGQTIAVNGTRPAQTGQIYVDSKVISPDPNTKPINLIWRLKNNDGDYKIADLIVEGVSMVMTYRSEYAAILQNNSGSVSALTDSLKAKNKVLAKSLGI